MFGYAPTVNDMSGQIMGSGMADSARISYDGRVGAAKTGVDTAQTNSQAMGQMGQNIGSTLTSIGNMYGKFKDKKDMLAGMDKSVDAMSDMGAVTKDFYEKYMNAPNNVRPYLFEAVASPMFKSYSAGQSAAAQAQAWDKYKKTWGASAGGDPDGFTY